MTIGQIEAGHLIPLKRTRKPKTGLTNQLRSLGVGDSFTVKGNVGETLIALKSRVYSCARGVKENGQTFCVRFDSSEGECLIIRVWRVS